MIHFDAGIVSFHLLVGFDPDVCDGTVFVLVHQGRLALLGLEILLGGCVVVDSASTHLLAGIAYLILEFKNVILARWVCLLPFG